ncbi:MAG TPA: hypothetical protein VFK57_24710 [Vicinamibacterales bacterium]|nr:hypothetical protein [Vicinamibacterales bacterium]
MKIAACAIAACLAAGAVLPAAATAGRSPGVVWLFLVDDLHIDFRTTGVVRTWLASLVRDLVREEDAFAARTTGPSRLSIGLLAGKADLEQGVRRISGSAIRFADVRRMPEAAGELAYRAQVTMKAAAALLSIAPQHDPRPCIMLYIGNGFDVIDGAVDETSDFLREAWRRDVRLIALDLGTVRTAQMPPPPAGDAEWIRVVNARRSSLEQLALPTQGFVLAGDEALREAAVRISNAVR